MGVRGLVDERKGRLRFSVERRVKKSYVDRVTWFGLQVQVSND
jgi:hypothetical protein